MIPSSAVPPNVAPPEVLAADPPTGSVGMRVATEAMPELDRARAYSVRLVISIPVLTLLVVLGSGSVLYLYLMQLAEASWLVPQTRQSLERAALVILLISIAVSLLSAAMGYVLARQIVRPIKQLMDTMDQIAEGDLNTKLQPIRLGEFGQLGNSFNRMVEQLHHLFEERNRHLHESFVGGHVVVDATGRVLKADQAVRRVFGVEPEKLIGTNVLEEGSDLPVLRNNPKLRAVLEEVVQSTLRGHPHNRMVTLRERNDRIIGQFMVSSLRLETEVGPQAQVMLEIRDLAGIASFYEQIQRADRLAAIGTLATGIAHEVRNPLASIRGMVQLLNEFSEDEHHRDYHQRILREVDRVEKLVAGVMDFAHTGSAPAENTDLNALMADVVDCVRHRLAPASDAVQVEWQLAKNLPPAMLRSDRVRQAMLNLVTNAFQHCLAHRVGPVLITTHWNPENQMRPLAICVSNPGERIDDREAERLFEPFYTTKPDGTGLGLPIAYQVIQSNGGVLEMRCEAGNINFWVRLPQDIHLRESATAVPRRPMAAQAG